MQRRNFLTTTAVGAGTIMVPSLLWAGADSKKRPNILFIMTDQQQARMMSSADNKWLKTPSLDGLVAEGIRFEKRVK